jgi:peptidoglycan/xylan/chitin deacetylase (PgdA/CDA1 family)
MDLSDQYGLRSAFYFIADRTMGAIDGSYRLDDPFVAGLIRRIASRGHEIGLHGSYNSDRRAEQTKKEFERLRNEAERQGVAQVEWGGRQHYLRWENPLTWRTWDAAGLDYDSTLGYVDQIGFRSGICSEYPAFDLQAGQPLRLRERPLLVMDGTLFSYMKLSADAAIARTVEIARRSMMYGGDFVLLWHNHSLASARERHLYRTLVQRVVHAR